MIVLLSLIVLSSELFTFISSIMVISVCLLFTSKPLWLGHMVLGQTLMSSGPACMLILLLIISFYTCMLVLPVMGQSVGIMVKTLMGVITILCKNFFFSCSSVSLFVYFELSLIPIFLIIMGWGYQTERMGASLALFLYTALGSIPLLLLILIHINSHVSILTMIVDQVSTSGVGLFSWPVLAFLIKLPMTGVHMWLPKAHVEAPVVGSMFLAAVLLKLGGWGMLVYKSLMVPLGISVMLSSASILGLVWFSLICCQTVDSKILIAFSSVIHMSFVVFGVAVGSEMGMFCAVLVMLSHGFSSSVAFFLVFCFYKAQNSRSLVMSKTLMSSSGLLNLIWLGTILALVGCPPSFNLWVEMVCYMTFSYLMPSILKTFFWGALLGGVYGFLLLGKIYWGSDFNFKSSFKLSQVELMQGLMSVMLTIIMSFTLPIIFL